VDGHLEPEGRPPPLTGGKSGRLFLKVIEHAPEKLFGHLRRTLAIGMRMPVSTGRGCAADRGQRTGMQLQAVAQVIEPDAMRQFERPGGSRCGSTD